MSRHNILPALALMSLLGVLSACGEDPSPTQPSLNNSVDPGDVGEDGAEDDAEVEVDAPDNNTEDDVEGDTVEDDVEDDAPDNNTEPLGLCELCTDDAQCGGPEDLCLELPNELQGATCATDCTADTESCPEGYGCALVREAPAEVRQCVPLLLLCNNPCDGVTCETDGDVCHPVTGDCGPALGLCEAGCIDNDECGDEDDTCLVLPDTGERICARSCGELELCPAGYFCANTGTEEEPGMQCVPENLTCVDRCGDVQCAQGEVCDPITGECGQGLGLCDQDCTVNALCGDSPDDICISLGTPDDERICATGCDVAADCPVNFFCAELDGRARGVCIPLEITCRDDRCDGVDCGDGANCDPLTGECVASTLTACESCGALNSNSCGGPLDLCLNLGDPAGVICTVDCSETETCPDGYDCLRLTNTTRSACVPIGGDCRRCDNVTCEAGSTCNPETGECVAPPVSCAEAECDAGFVCNPDTEQCERIGAPCNFDTRFEDCYNQVLRCSATRPGADGVCALRCDGDDVCTPAAPNCVDLDRVGPLCIPDGLGGPTTCGILSPEDVEIGRRCGAGVSTRCAFEAPVCIDDVEVDVPGFCSRGCVDDAECGGAGTCQTVRGRQGRFCVPTNCLCLTGTEVPEGTTDLVERALSAHQLSRCGLSIDPNFADLLDPGTPSAPLKDQAVGGLVAQPLSAIDVGKDLAGRLSATTTGDSPLRDAIILAAARQGYTLEARTPSWAVPDDVDPFTAGIREFMTAAGGTFDAGDINGDPAAVQAPLQAELGDVLFAAAAVLRERQALADALGLAPADLEALFAGAPYLFLPAPTPDAVPDLADPDTLGLLRDFDLHGLYQAAADLAATLDASALAVDPANAGADVSYQTPAGWIRVGGDGPTTWDPVADVALAEPIALLVDLSGDDVYSVQAGATAAATQPVGLLLDLDGDDVYHYPEVADERDIDAWLPSDVDGRMEPLYPVIRGNGPVSLSTRARQGAGVLGVGVLVDRGAGDDTYTSLRTSQGAGVLGVGALDDAGGSDTYTVEAMGQGAALLGVGVLLDRGQGAQNNAFRAWHAAQGFGAGSGVGLLINASGDDTYLGERATGPADVLYFSPPDRSLSNLNLTQGAGAGLFPPDDRDPDRQAIAGGQGVLFDASGADVYTAATFAQGAGYHLGAGFLIDADGDDQYNARHGGQGAGSTLAIGVHLDLAGDDQYGVDVDRVLGATHGYGVDLGAGVMVDFGGDDTYAVPSFSAGVGVNNGLAVFFDLGGVDTYTAVSLSTLGTAVLTPDLIDADDPRTRVPTFGVFIDAGADADTYTRIDLEDDPFIGDDLVWLQRTSDDLTLPELGVGVDGEGQTGFETPVCDLLCDHLTACRLEMCTDTLDAPTFRADCLTACEAAPPTPEALAQQLSRTCTGVNTSDCNDDPSLNLTCVCPNRQVQCQVQCSEDDLCGDGPEDRCAPLGDTAFSYCALGCLDGSCPSGYVCMDVMDVGMVCTPESGDCE